MTKAAELAKMGEIITDSQVGGRRNMFLNPDMQIAQRGTSLAIAHDGTVQGYLIDRWRISFNATDQIDGTYAQVNDHPLNVNGKSLKWTTGTAESAIDSNEYGYFAQIIEAQHLQHLYYGNSNAKTITLSFYVKSSVTGTFAVGIYKADSTTRIFNKTYTIDSANTWEKKTVTFIGDTDSSATIDNNNGQGFYVNWHLFAGTDYTDTTSTSGWVNYSTGTWANGQATNAIGTTASATWQLADCQLEVGEQATPFEHRSFGEELALCQRYYERYETSGANYARFGLFQCTSTTTAFGAIDYKVSKRSASVTLDTELTRLALSDSDNSMLPVTAIAIDSNCNSFENTSVTITASGGGLVAGECTQLLSENVSNGYIAIDAEL